MAPGTDVDRGSEGIKKRQTPRHTEKLALDVWTGLADGETTAPGSSACLVHTVEQGGRVIPYSRIKETCLADLSRSSFYRGQSSGSEYPGEKAMVDIFGTL